MGKVKYVVHYGVPFNVRQKSFETEYEAKSFIASHIFADSRFCRLEKVIEMDIDFSYAPHYEMPTKDLRDKMFNYGLIKYAELEEVVMGE